MPTVTPIEEIKKVVRAIFDYYDGDLSKDNPYYEDICNIVERSGTRFTCDGNQFDVLLSHCKINIKQNPTRKKSHTDRIRACLAKFKETNPYDYKMAGKNRLTDEEARYMFEGVLIKTDPTFDTFT